MVCVCVLHDCMLCQGGKQKLVAELDSLLCQAPHLIELELYNIALEIGCEHMFITLMHLAIRRATQLLQAP